LFVSGTGVINIKNLKGSQFINTFSECNSTVTFLLILCFKQRIFNDRILTKIND